MARSPADPSARPSRGFLGGAGVAVLLGVVALRLWSVHAALLAVGLWIALLVLAGVAWANR